MIMRHPQTIRRDAEPHPHFQHVLRIGWIVLLVILILLVLAPKAGGHHDSVMCRSLRAAAS